MSLQSWILDLQCAVVPYKKEVLMLSGTAYQPYLIKEYPYWSLFLHTKQSPYVGRCYAWWKDRKPGEGEGMQAGLLPKEARGWLFDCIFWEVVRACKTLGYSTDQYGPGFLLNMACLANEGHLHNHHMHWHFIPRSPHPIILKETNLRFEDAEWGKQYAKPIFGEYGLAEPHLQYIRRTMAEAVGGVL
jgi:hypothetical protein